jgi:hypothetical protein
MDHEFDASIGKNSFPAKCRPFRLRATRSISQTGPESKESGIREIAARWLASSRFYVAELAIE